MSATEKLLRYVKMDTTSDENSATVPSTKGQMVLAEELKKDLEALGLETKLDDNGYLFGYLKSNTDKKLKKLGLLTPKPRAVRMEMTEAASSPKRPFTITKTRGGKSASMVFPLSTLFSSSIISLLLPLI